MKVRRTQEERTGVAPKVTRDIAPMTADARRADENAGMMG
jgi:hypothetical protein